MAKTIERLTAELKQRESEAGAVRSKLRCEITLGDKEVRMEVRPQMDDVCISLRTPQYGVGGTSEQNMFIPLKFIWGMAAFLNRLLEDESPTPPVSDCLQCGQCDDCIAQTRAFFEKQVEADRKANP